MTYRIERHRGGSYWKIIVLLLFVIGCNTIVHRSTPHILLVSSHKDCGTVDEIVLDTARDDAEEIDLFGRPIR